MRIVSALCVAIAASLGSGCLAWVIPEYPPPAPGSDGSSPSDLAPAAGSVDGGGGGGGGSGSGVGGGVDGGAGGAALRFADVQVGLDQKGCTAAACHGGLQTPQLKAAPASDADKMATYTAFKTGCAQGKCVDAATPLASLVLTKPLAGSGLTHVGGKLYADFNDAVYTKWLAWIQAGAPY